MEGNSYSQFKYLPSGISKWNAHWNPQAHFCCLFKFRKRNLNGNFYVTECLVNFNLNLKIIFGSSQSNISQIFWANLRVFSVTRMHFATALNLLTFFFIVGHTDSFLICHVRYMDLLFDACWEKLWLIIKGLWAAVRPCLMKRLGWKI